MNAFPLPRRILMATDLGARCDRALARAALLARSWQSELSVLHVVHSADAARHERLMQGAPSWRRPESWQQVLERRLGEDLDAEGVAAAPRVALGQPVDAILRAAAEEEAALLVLGAAKDAAMDRIQLGSTVDALMRRSPAPVLSVRGRARHAYRHVVVASDFSEPAMQALRLAAHWFGDARLTLFHAYAPHGTLPAVGGAGGDSQLAALTLQRSAHVVSASLPAHAEAGLTCLLECGPPETLLADYVQCADVDLVVLGSHGRSGLAHALLGSTAESLLHTLDCDTLVVRGH